MSATLTITHSTSNLPSEDLLKHSYPPAKPSSFNATAALDNPLDQVGISIPAAAAPVDNSTSRKTALWREKTVFATMCSALFLAGWNDGTTGPLLPRIQQVYHIGFAVVSLIFIASCVGFVSGSVANVYLTDKYPFGILITAGSLAQVTAYAIQTSSPPFPVLLIAYAINGFGMSLQDAQANGLVANLQNKPEEKMGILHAIYGLGAMSSPLVATQFAQLPRWSFHYLVSLVVAMVNTVALLWVIRGREMEDVLIDIGSPPKTTDLTGRPTFNNEGSDTEAQAVPATPSTSASATTANQPVHQSSYKQILSLKAVHLMAFYILVYVGVEVTIGGWIVTYLIHERGGGSSSGYVSSGFFGGLTLGRVALLWVNRKIGERRAVFIYAALAIGLEVTVWFVPSLIENALAVSVVGLLLGPMYPICMNQAGRVLPRRVLTGSIGWIAGFGQAGSAILPFMTGALASRFGISSLQPLIVVMMAFMAFLWTLVPSTSKRAE